MAKLPIIEFPDPRLRTIAKPVAQVDADLRQLIDDMLETMYDAPGIGLAATQVDVHVRLLVLDISEEHNQPQVFINPEILMAEGSQVYQEGCLSVPGYYADVKRANTITVKALDRDGHPFELTTDGLLAICLQHEMDHLAGKVFVDYLSPLKKALVRKKLAKQRKLAAEDGDAA
jgi:peptide deformylase